MRVISQHRWGGPEVLQPEDRPDVHAGDHEVRVRVEAAGVHLLDTAIRAGGQGPGGSHDLPMVPGREVAQEGLHAVPDGLDAASAVASIGTGRTAVGLLDQVRFTDVDVAIVTSAAGGLGAMLVQRLRVDGVFVVGLSGGPEKVEVVRGIGADEAVDYLDEGWDDIVRDVAGPVTLLLDGVGGEVSRRAQRLLVDGGTVLTFGWSSGSPADIDPRLVETSPLGPQHMSRPGGLRSLEAEALQRAVDGTMTPVVGGRYRLEDAAAAHRDLQERRTHGKVVLVP